MADTTDETRAKAQSRFLETQKKQTDRKTAASEYEQEARARTAKTAKLKALRVAKEEADRVAAAAAPVSTKSKRASVAKVVLRRGVGSS
jgi:hypothetical protein